MFLAALLDAASKTSRSPKFARAVVVLAAFLVAAANFGLAVWPNHSQASDEMENANAAMRYVQAGDLLLIARFDWTDQLRFLCRECEVLSAIGLAQSVERTNVGRTKEQIFERFAHTWESGRSVYLPGYIADPEGPYWKD